MAHFIPAGKSGAYASSKAGAASMFQCLADEVPISTMQILNIHPGSILSDAARAAGYKEDSIPWDNGEYFI
jgi:NAD(P)-dependent dehydrogenase (short-subunit alcohol dehydrogenase family)